MSLLRAMAQGWKRVGTRWLPFADAATPDLPLPRLLRLSLIQVSVGMAAALLIGTLNRVMIVEMGVSAALVAVMVAIPLLIAPLRAVVGHRSDHHRSYLGWRRVPYIWMGTLIQFGGLAIMPFALILLSGDTRGPEWIGATAAALAFLLVGAGLQTTQTAGLALAADLAAPPSRPRVVALMYVMLLFGMLGGGLAFAMLLDAYTPVRLIRVVQGAALATMALNLFALWKQEPRDPSRTRPSIERPDFLAAWRAYRQRPGATRFLLATGLGTAAFSMQDIILEPYGAEVLGLGVGATASLTALSALGALAAVALAAHALSRGIDPLRLAGVGVIAGLAAFSAVVFAAPLESSVLFRGGTLLIGFGGGFFFVSTLTHVMGMEAAGLSGLALGAWGAVQAAANGLAVALGGVLRDVVGSAASVGLLGPALADSATGYSFVYHLEIALLFGTLVALGPLVHLRRASTPSPHRFGLASLPG